MKSMPDTSNDWARAYAKQALSDLDAREALVRAGALKCHRLHFLQMAAEKACKAHLIVKNPHSKLKRSHAVVEGILPIIARQFYPLENDNNAIAQWEIVQIRALSHEIEALAPACDHGDSRKDNTEYPWEDGTGQIRVPCEYNFPNLDDGNRTIVRVIRLIRKAAESYGS